ncbi:MAG: hypothetical protein PVH11_11870 [Anaerolineae bacterium]|jgi:hypothetical protein
MEQEQSGTPRLPVRQNPALLYALSWLVALLMAAASVAGLLYPTALYPAEELFEAFVPSDLVNLLIGLPVLLGSLGLARRGRLIGLLLWPGALLFVLYNEVVYVFALPFSLGFLLHLSQLTLSVYMLIGLIASIDGAAVQRRLTRAVPERVAGGVLAALGVLFFLRVIVVMAGAIASQTPVLAPELALHLADFVIAPGMVTGGLLLWRRQRLGYVTGLGLLFQASMLFVGLIVVLLLQPFLLDAPFAPLDVVVVFVLGLICFVPFVLFARGVLLSHPSSPG